MDFDKLVAGMDAMRGQRKMWVAECADQRDLQDYARNMISFEELTKRVVYDHMVWINAAIEARLVVLPATEA